MGELRKDYLLDRWVVISPKRGARPYEFKDESKTQVRTDFFAPGNENLTPKEIGRVPKNGSWQVRWFENKFAALKLKGKSKPETHNRFYTFSDNYGRHEIIVETPRSDKQLESLPIAEIETVLHVYARRIVELEKNKKIAYVNVFKNSGIKAGTSIIHSHSQIIATSFVPTAVQEKINASRKFVECPYCQIVKEEKKSDRRCFENKDFVAFCPYASRFNYEVIIMPKKHITRLEKVDFSNLARIVSKVLKKVKKLGASYNMFIHYSPRGENLHLQIEVCPRIATWAGFELGTDVIINTVAPEDAAKFYRGEE